VTALRVRRRPAPRRSLATAIGVTPRTISRYATEGRLPAGMATRLPSGKFHYDLESDEAAAWVASRLNRKEQSARNG